MAQNVNAGSSVSGLLADRPATPLLGQTYTASDTNHWYLCLTAGAWIDMGAVSSGGTLNTQTSAVGIGNGADATDDTLFTYTLPANSLGVAGQSVRVFTSGVFVPNSSGSNIRAAVWFAGTAIADTGASDYDSTSWTAEIIVTRIDATHVSASGTILIESGNHPGSLIVNQPNLAVANLTSNTSIIKTTGKTDSSIADEVIAYQQKVWIDN